MGKLWRVSNCKALSVVTGVPCRRAGEDLCLRPGELLPTGVDSARLGRQEIILA